MIQYALIGFIFLFQINDFKEFITVIIIKGVSSIIVYCKAFKNKKKLYESKDTWKVPHQIYFSIFYILMGVV